MAIIIKFPREPRDREPPNGRGTNTLHRRILGVAFSVTIVAGGAICLYFGGLRARPPTERPVTGSLSTVKGEHHCWKLPDSSEACLNTATVVHYSFTRRARNLEIEAGEATITVHGDERPFEVLSGSMLIRDLSTSFNVRKKEGATVLTVVDGRVKVMAPVDTRLHQQFVLAEPEPGWNAALEFQSPQQLEFDEATESLHERPPLSKDQISQLLAWHHGRLDLTSKRLIEALDEISRFQGVDEFNVPDPVLRQLPLDGDCDPTDLRGFLRALSGKYGIRYSFSHAADGRTTVNLTRQQNAPAHSKYKEGG